MSAAGCGSGRRMGPAMLRNLRITQRLGLLLLIAVAAMTAASVPGVVERVDDARAAQAVQHSAERVHTTAVAVAELQRERLLALAYVLSDRVGRTALVSQVHTADEAAAAVPEGRASVAALRKVRQVRQAVLRRDAEPSRVVRVYHDTVVTLLNQLRLTDQPDADVIGQRELSSLDTLMRLDEEAGVGVAALLVAVGDQTVAGLLARDSATLVQSHWERFQRQAIPRHVTILAATETGPSALRSGAAIAALTHNETPGRSGPTDKCGAGAVDRPG